MRKGEDMNIRHGGVASTDSQRRLCDGGDDNDNDDKGGLEGATG